MIRDIYLYGSVAEEFGSKWTLDVESPGEAAHAININTNGKFSEFIRDIQFKVVRGSDLDGEVLDKSMLSMNSRRGDFHFCPAAKGSGASLIYGIILVGIFLAGAAIMIASMPTIRPEDAMEDDIKGYSFNSTSNISRQGIPVPLAYGEVYAGSVIISKGIRIEELV